MFGFMRFCKFFSGIISLLILNQSVTHTYADYISTDSISQISNDALDPNQSSVKVVPAEPVYHIALTPLETRSLGLDSLEVAMKEYEKNQIRVDSYKLKMGTLIALTGAGIGAYLFYRHFTIIENHSFQPPEDALILLIGALGGSSFSLPIIALDSALIQTFGFPSEVTDRYSIEEAFKIAQTHAYASCRAFNGDNAKEIQKTTLQSLYFLAEDLGQGRVYLDGKQFSTEDFSRLTGSKNTQDEKFYVFNKEIECEGKGFSSIPLSELMRANKAIQGET